MIRQFLLDPAITYLNHGSFGACPQIIFNDYQYWQKRLEFEPVQFFIKNGIEALAYSKEKFAAYFSCHANDVVFMPNPSTAFNTVINSLPLKATDEILSTDLEYGAMLKTWDFHCKKTGATFIQQKTDFPILSKEQFLENFWKGLTPNTKYVFLSHITSSTALILPVKEIIDKARSLGIKSIIDGAHVPGHIPLNLRELDPDYYTGALHKWMLAPKGFSFLYVKKEWQKNLNPLIVSWGYESEFPGKSQFLDYHEFNGTRDFSAYLCFETIEEFFKHFDWLTHTSSRMKVLKEWYPKFCSLLKTTPICPLNEKFLGLMCSIPIKTKNPVELKHVLYNQYKIEIPITQLGEQFYLRISYQVYNTEKDLQHLYNSLETLIQNKQIDL